ncbi:MAG TPA: hypothetical protein VHV82_08145 [Sporichthyaceae bacterium]|jgi:hypothetical protein|nr:hypothetical protein [Sporichthyaceae bacterium]
MLARPEGLTDSEREWLAVRAHLQEHRYRLSFVAAERYPEILKIADTPLLSTRAWLPSTGIEMQSVELGWTPAADRPGLFPPDALTEHLRPLRADGTRYPSYSAVVGALAAPKLFENRTTYRLRSADLVGPPRMNFEPGRYFDHLDVGDACAHELAAVEMGLRSETPLRDWIGNPCDPSRRPTNVAVSCLTIRHDSATGERTFPLHWRDPAKVGHAGGMTMVIPVGIFQAAADGWQHQEHDLAFLRLLIREYAEELLGQAEKSPGEHLLDYDAWPFARAMSKALADGRISSTVLGIGVDALTFATDILAVISFDSEAFDGLFSGSGTENAEGTLQCENSGVGPAGYLLSGDVVDDLLARSPFQAAGAALMRLAAASPCTCP